MFVLPATTSALPVFAVKVWSFVIVTMFVAPDVVIPFVPSISSSFAIGIAVPLFVMNSVGIEGVLFTRSVTSM